MPSLRRARLLLVCCCFALLVSAVPVASAHYDTGWALGNVVADARPFCGGGSNSCWVYPTHTGYSQGLSDGHTVRAWVSYQEYIWGFIRDCDAYVDYVHQTRVGSAGDLNCTGWRTP